jgi:superfamily II DNA or RNA helicase
MQQAVLSDYLWVPRSAVAPHHLQAFSYRLFDQYTRESYQVDTFTEELDHYRFPRGNLSKLRQVFGDTLQFDDQRVSVPFEQRLRFTGKLYDEQKELVRTWLGRGYGLIQAPPRSGKTVMMTALVCKLRQRTLMLAHLEDLCHQLEETIRKFTNVNELEQEWGEKLVGVLDEWDDFFPIATLTTYQCLAVSPRGRRVLRERRNDFGLVMADEVHRVKTEYYRGVIETTTAAYRCGVTATPVRKDGMHVVVADTLGPVVAVGRGEQLPVQYTWEYTGFHVREFQRWTTLYNRLAASKTRDKCIADQIVADVQAGHHVLATTERLKHLDALKLAIQKIDPDITVGLLSGQTRDREGFRAATKRGDYQVVIAMSRIVELGYNIPRWSCFHNTMPMANRQNWYQRVSRIRTPMEPAFKGDDWQKPDPIARIWIDEGHAAIYAYRNIVKKENDRLGFECLNPPAKPRTTRDLFSSTDE